MHVDTKELEEKIYIYVGSNAGQGFTELHLNWSL